MAQVRIVTDSTSDIPNEVAERLQITVMPVYVQMGGASYRDGLDLSREHFYTELPSAKVLPTTSVPPPVEFVTAYQQLQKDTDQLIVITVAKQLSSMYSVANVAAQEVPGLNVRVIDSGQLSMGLGWMVVAAAEAAAAGASSEEVISLVNDMRSRVHVFAALNTMEYVRRSGRVGWARAKAAEILQIKPILSLMGGCVRQLGQVRTMHQAIGRLCKLASSLGSLERLAVLHTYAPQLDELRHRLGEFLPVDRLLTVAATTAIGVHVGPQGLGLAAVSAK
ncbi:MAG: DegV family protein [Anaerolineales bacterium]|nr:DegV family protein [Anaerolineales bacterium]